MIKAFSFTCLRDKDCVLRLHDQFQEMGISHTMYVDEDEFNDFSKFAICKSRGRHENGTNGFGWSGFLAKLECIKDMYNNTEVGDTILDCDSDVFFNNKNVPFEMMCEPLEYKGFCDLNTTTHEVLNNKFSYFTGAIKSYNRDLAEKIITEPLDKHKQDMIDFNITPGEDGFQSYFYSLYGRFTNMSDKFLLLKQNKDYERKDADIIS